MTNFSKSISFFFFNDTATTEIYTLSLHDALPILEIIQGFSAVAGDGDLVGELVLAQCGQGQLDVPIAVFNQENAFERSEEHTSELQSRLHLVCRLLLEKKKIT